MRRRLRPANENSRRSFFVNPSSAAISSPPQTPGQWLVALGSIILIDIVLAGDNAIAIALAVRNLPQKKRPLGIAIGACGAVVLRIALTSVIASILIPTSLK